MRSLTIGRGRLDPPVEIPWTGWPAPSRRHDGGGGQPTRVLVPYNGTTVARKAIDVATDLTRGRSALVWILYVRSWQVSRGGTRFCLESKDEARECAQAAVTELRRRGVAASAIVRDARREKVAMAIAAEAETREVSCIVLGTHARRALGSALLGSTSLTVARQATRPIIMVKTPNTRRRWRRPGRFRGKRHDEPD